MESDPGDYIGAGRTWDYTASDIAFGLNGSRNSAEVSLNGSTFWYLNFAAPQGTNLDAGLYPNATRWPFQDAGAPGLSVAGDGRGCNQLTGAFLIKQIEFNVSGQPTALWAQFEQHCEGGSAALRGDVRYNVTIAVEVTAPFVRSTPRGRELEFDVSARSATGLPLTLTAVGAPVGSEFVDHGDGTGTFRWTPGLDQIGRVAVTFAARDGAGGTDASITTIEVTGETSLVMVGDDGDALGQGQSYYFTPEVGEFRAFRNSDGTVSMIFDAQPLREWSFQFRAPGPFGTALSPGYYPGATTDSPFGESTVPRLSIFGKSRSCSDGEGAFHVKRLRLGAGNVVESMWIVFAQRCSGLDAGLNGEIRYNADVRIGVSAPLERTLLRGQSVRFGVVGTRADSGDVALALEGGPPGATFTDHGNGNATFDWNPGDAPIADYDVRFIGEGPSGVRDTALTRIRLRGANALVVDSDPGDPIAGGVDSRFARGDARYSARKNPAGGVTIQAASRTTGSQYQLDFAAPFNVPLVPGTYSSALRYPATDARMPGLLVQRGFFGACNELAGSFVVHEIRYGPGESIESFRASFEQLCTGSAGGLRGEVRWNADLPVVVSAPGFVTARRGERTTFEVSAYVRAGGVAALSATGLPTGATFSDLGNNRGVFDWTPLGTQIGLFRIGFFADGPGDDGDETSTQIEVTFLNNAPLANAGGPYRGIVGRALEFDGSGSSDLDGDALFYSWATGDGGFVQGVNPLYAYSAAGVYPLRLEVWDGSTSAVDTATVVIAPLLSARAFVLGGDGNVRLTSGKQSLCVHIEPIGGSFALADVDASTIGLRYFTPGGLRRISAVAGSVHVDRDRDRNGVVELEACFAKEDLRGLFVGSSGSTTLVAVVDGAVADGRGFEANLVLTVTARSAAAGFAVRSAPDGGALEFVTERNGPLRVEVFDLRGRRVGVPRDDPDAPAGRHHVALGGMAAGRRLAPGIYFYRVKSIDGEATGRLVHLVD